ncbi:MAG: hypothetical protein M3519_08035, partial [Actinomycetota bacterium]|nr:hypothetical protein [Actinomycetota bacterium]
MRHHRPAPVDPQRMDIPSSGSDPAEVTETAHRTAEVLVGAGRASDDPELTRRLVGLVRELGLSTVAEMWADRPARSLPGALWRLYLLHEWVQRQPVEVGRAFTAGSRHAEVYRVIAGVSEPPGPEDLRTMTDQILTGVFDGDLADALERAAAFCHVMAVGLAGPDADPDEIQQEQVHRASRLQATAEDLLAGARL